MGPAAENSGFRGLSERRARRSPRCGFLSRKDWRSTGMLGANGGSTGRSHITHSSHCGLAYRFSALRIDAAAGMISASRHAMRSSASSSSTTGDRWHASRRVAMHARREPTKSEARESTLPRTERIDRRRAQ